MSSLEERRNAVALQGGLTFRGNLGTTPWLSAAVAVSRRATAGKCTAGIRFRHGERLFCNIDDFCVEFEPRWETQLLTQGIKTRKREKRLSLSEIMTILVAFHQHHYRRFKHYYLAQVRGHWQQAFPGLPSYQRFALMDALYCIAAMCLLGTT